MEENTPSSMPIDKNKFIRMIDDLKKSRQDKSPADPAVFQEILNMQNKKPQET